MMCNRRCTAATRSGRPCRAWAVRGSEPPRCASHGGARPDPGSWAIPTAGDDHAPIDIGAIIADLAAKQALLSRYIEQCTAEETIPLRDLARLLALHAQTASRLGRLLRDQRALGGDSADAFRHAIDQALDELSGEWELEL
jgi:hypothetical protein